MASFSLARVPYYISVTIFSGLSALVAFWNNASVHGLLSDFYLVIMACSLILCAASVMYLFAAKAGQNDEVDLSVAGLQMGKSIYYVGVITLALFRIAVGYVENHSGTGMQSIWGVLWLLAGIGILAFTYANYSSYTAKKPKVNPASSVWPIDR